MLDAIIFDVDGTLVDTVDYHAEAWERAFAQFGHSIEVAAIRVQIGKGGDQLMPVFLSKDEVERTGTAIEAWRKDLFTREYLPRVVGFPDVRALFDRLIADGRKVALASSAKGDELQAYKKAAGIADIDMVETSSDDAEKSKPHPDIFEAALGRLELPPDRCVVVGDTPYDAEAAYKAGLATIGLLCGGFPEADIRGGGATAIFADPADLLRNYDRWIEAFGG